MSRTIAPDLVENLKLCRKQHAQRPALIHGPRQITFEALDQISDALASNFAARGWTGKAVGILTPTIPELAMLYFAGFKSGTTVVPINHSFRPAELMTVLRNCPLHALVTDASLAGLALEAGDAAAAIPHKFMIGAPAGGRFGFEPYDVLERPTGAPFHKSPLRPGLIFHTSGTTGRPKGVVHTLTSASHFALCYRTLCRGEPDPVTLIARNCYHSGGFYHLTGALSAGATCVLAEHPDGFDAEAFVEDVVRHRVTQVFVSVSMLNAILSAPNLSPRTFRDVAFVSAGADEVKPSHHARLRNYTDLPLSVRYSSTEATCVAVNADADVGLREKSVGTPFSHFEWRLETPPDGGDAGELLLRGPAVFLGYHNNPEADAAAFTADGWYRTGDLFRHDGQGGLAFFGRRHDAIKVGGKFVYPVEIETEALAFPGVAEAVAVAAPHDVQVQVPRLFVRLRSPQDPFDPEALRAWLRERLAAYKVPVEVEVLDAMPLTPGGKTDRRKLSERVRRTPAAPLVPHLRAAWLVSESASDVMGFHRAPAGMKRHFCTTSWTEWYVRHDDPRCPGCGENRSCHARHFARASSDES